MAASLNEKTQVQIERKDPQVGVASGAHKWLVAIGAAVLVVWVALVVVNWQFGSEVTETTAGGTKTTKTKELASETLLAALLGTGAALILVGFLYARISSIKLPGGVEILTEKEKESTAEGVTEGLSSDATPEQAVAATQAAEGAVRTVKAAGSGELSPTAVKEIAMKVASEVA